MLKTIRIKRKMTLEQLSAKTGLNLQHLHQIESGKLLPHKSTRDAIETALGCKINWHKQRLLGTFDISYLENESPEETVAKAIYLYIKSAPVQERITRLQFLTSLIKEINKHQ